MRSRSPLLAITIPILMLAAGCAQPARVDRMIASQSPQSAALPAQSPLHRAIGTTVVEGGRTTIPIFTPEVDNDAFISALRESLNRNGLLAGTAAPARYTLQASLIRADQPVRGLNKTVLTTIRYRLRDVASGRVVYDEQIDSRFTVTFDDEPIASSRHRQANEGAMRQNLEKLIERLRAFRPAV